jgi:hypothetical protein
MLVGAFAIGNPSTALAANWTGSGYGAMSVWAQSEYEVFVEAHCESTTPIAAIDYNLSTNTLGSGLPAEPWVDGSTVLYYPPDVYVIRTKLIRFTEGFNGKRDMVVCFAAYDDTGSLVSVSQVYWNSIMCDDTQPVTFAPHATTVKRNATATFRYKVGDNLSPRASVLIRIDKRVAGGRRKVLTMQVGTVSTGKMHSYSYPCRLLRGTYRFTVLATDEAGNHALTRGQNRLTVR